MICGPLKPGLPSKILFLNFISIIGFSWITHSNADINFMALIQNICKVRLQGCGKQMPVSGRFSITCSMSHTVQDSACAPCLFCGPCSFDLSNRICHFGFEDIKNSIKMFRFYNFLLKLLFNPPLLCQVVKIKKQLVMSEREFKVILSQQMRNSFCYIFKKLI